MYCKNCGTPLVDNASFCHNCGAQNDVPCTYTQQVSVQQPYVQYVSPEYTAQTKAKELANEILKWGIMGLAFASSFILSFLGIIFSKKAINLSEEYIRLQGQTDGKARVGRHLAKGGFYGGIGMTVLFGIYILIMLLYGILIATIITSA